ncbi:MULTISPECIES: aminotransferase [unclassified Sphingobium]|uniref:aminotransferase n=1 Tax=unclassified Sphingobium TaxID=2611147 RepID=UPI000D179676|nr:MULTISPECIES: aminotransferase [unclassified Sphingobium]MBG6118676.1 aspartate/methionine/tyrosine aminotransferase [Sphingobium sp. JAI105]PSO13760.1 aminotransferase [Sphingobium sp. AEW4]TWD10645.1 aspartate/methionine/tyrosine aminotransferase [Sphingobium sp. AEW010]TWD27950.1 aspartate/methionine/tyrosine aminotransferase [Sphingobium sp. AEW013]TWD28979.1 aspartate/methionine/tyrosine aminotransferase [Sphingobium sp. AEW001]
MTGAAHGHPVYRDMPTTIFEQMSALARETGAINLGQGFPDTPGPADILNVAADALLSRSNQYPPMAGLPELRAAVASHYAAHQGLALTPQDVIVTSGATEAIAATLLALVQPGDEVLVLAPLYDAYLPLIERAGGVAKVVRLTPPEWRITQAALEAAASPRTRFLLMNNPVNPTGIVLRDGELALLARFCVDRDLIAICDEVWEHLTFDGLRHRPLMAQPGMGERTVKIGSAGKIFSLTGWKDGWMCAAPPIVTLLARAHQFLTFTTPPNLQWAVAKGLAKPVEWFSAMRADYQASRDRLVTGLRAAGFVLLPSRATWFVCVDLPGSGIAMDDRAFCERIVRDAGVAAIPISAFYPDEPVTHLVRLCFSKADAVLDEAVARLADFRRRVVAGSGEGR